MKAVLTSLLKIKNLPITLICCWFVFLLLNAIFTPLHVDECYYWMFGKNLDWGYFDHPPGVAVLIYLSDTIFSGTLSVRFFSIVAHILSYYLIYTLIDHQKKDNRFFLAFFLFCITLPLNHLYGFITTPDVPLILTTCLFFVLYKKILKENKTWLFVLWGISMTLMLYSKYHGILVIFFTVISNPRLFLNPRFYLTAIIGAVGFIPHLIWQYDHDFASFYYHLQERLIIYKWSYPLEFWLNLILIINPLMLMLFIKLVRKIPKSKFELALFLNLIGFVLFFAYQSFKVQVQPQWLIIIYIPFIILFFNRFGDSKLNFISKSFLILFPFLLMLHVFMIFDILPHDLDIHRKKEYVEMIEEDAQGRPVMFLGSYGRASIYSWYSDQEQVHSHNGPRNRKNQFNIWEIDTTYFNQDIYMVGEYGHGDWHKKYPGGYRGVPRVYYPSDKIKLFPVESTCLKDSINAKVEIINQYDFDLDLKENYVFKVLYYYEGRANDVTYQLAQNNELIKGNQRDTISFTWPKPVEAFNSFGFTIANSKGLYGPIYRRIELECK